MVAAVPCVEECQDDGPDGECAPTCEDCVCCAHPRAGIGAPMASVLIESARGSHLVAPEQSPPEGELEEILRVPKRA